jgi:glycosyltransferase involved in cell wall biosynthesis
VCHQINVAPDLPAIISESLEAKPDIHHSSDHHLRIVFLSRISPKKNLDFAIEILKNVNVAVEFNIYGLICEEKYWTKCKEIIDNLPDHIKVEYHGVINHNLVSDVLSYHDLFILPTKGENYGHAIFEALAAGVPALISDQTPWQNLEEEGVGWVCSLHDKGAFIDVIQRLSQTTASERIAKGDRARNYAAVVSQSEVVKEQNIKLFQNAKNFYR